MVKIIENNGDIKNLNYGDLYIINVDFSNPLNINFDKINKLQEKIENKFSTIKEENKK